MAWEFDAATAAWLTLTLVLCGVIAALTWLLLRQRRAARREHNSSTLLWIHVEVHNPLELARHHSRWGRHLGSLAPGVVTRRVHDIVSRELHSELADRGVEARVEVRRRSD